MSSIAFGSAIPKIPFKAEDAAYNVLSSPYTVLGPLVLLSLAWNYCVKIMNLKIKLLVTSYVFRGIVSLIHCLRLHKPCKTKTENHIKPISIEFISKDQESTFWSFNLCAIAALLSVWSYRLKLSIVNSQGSEFLATNQVYYSKCFLTDSK